MRTVTEPLYDILARRYLNPEEWRKVKSEADRLNLAFFATVGFEEDVLLLQEMGCDSIKIASSDVNHFPLIRLAARTGMCIQIDTGSSTLGEIEKAVDVILAEGNEKIVIHQCPSGYPARLESIHLRMIGTLRAMFPFPVAFSDHTPGWDMDIAALSLGASMVEKTITMDRTTPSVEHIFSLEGKQLPDFIRVLRDVETALGQPRRILSEVELERRKKYRRSMFAKRDLHVGETLSERDIEYRRPGTGLQPDFLDSIVGKLLIVDVAAGQMFTWQYLSE
jgi:sialic acid synthase SpsE